MLGLTFTPNTQKENVEKTNNVVWCFYICSFVL